MTWISMDFHSKTLKRPVELELLLPQSSSPDRVLFLLHGARENRMTWLMKSQIEYFAADKNICVVMPDGMNSFYVNTHNSYQFMDYICDELPALLKKMYFLPENRNCWMIAGNDMGGYGALRCGIQAGEVFGYIATFSGILDVVKYYEHCDFADMQNVFGEKENFPLSDNNLYKLFESNSHNISTNTLLTCGTEDDLLEDSRSFYEYVQNSIPQNSDLVFLTKSGAHDWHFWNDSLKCAIDWFCGNKNYKEGFTWQ